MLGLCPSSPLPASICLKEQLLCSCAGIFTGLTSHVLELLNTKHHLELGC